MRRWTLGCNTTCSTRLLVCTATATATPCITLQHTATHYNALQHPATHCSTLQLCKTHRNFAKHCNTPCHALRHPATPPRRGTLDMNDLCVCPRAIYSYAGTVCGATRGDEQYSAVTQLCDFVLCALCVFHVYLSCHMDSAGTVCGAKCGRGSTR